MIHVVIAGSLERCTAVLLEHYEGNLPLWLSPTQVKVIPVRENHGEYANKVHQALMEAGIRSEIDLDDQNLGTKVREAKTKKTPYWIVLGDKEVEAGKVTLESRDNGQLGQITVEELIEKIQAEIKNKK